MTQYIKKSALVAEIERLISIANSQYDLVGNEDIRNRILWSQQASVCNQILAFLNTLEVKEVDLEKEIQQHINDCLDIKFPTTNIELIKKDVEYTARKFFELGLKTKRE